MRVFPLAHGCSVGAGSVDANKTANRMRGFLESSDAALAVPRFLHLTPRAATLQCGCSWRKFEVPPLWIILGSHPWMIWCNNCLRWVTIVRHALDSAKLEKPWMSIFSAMSWLRAVYTLRGGDLNNMTIMTSLTTNHFGIERHDGVCF